MTMYAGETFLVEITATDYDRSSITPDEIASMTVTIRKGVATEVVAETAATWDEDREIWFYRWDTKVGSPAIVPGSYTAECKLTDFDDGESFEYKRIRLNRKVF